MRHHHENWDGTGYPDGISGVDIPIGARILSVVDCFDALTSDRPYRPALTAAAALEIVGQRRGSMYDPLVVDTFVKVQGSLVALAPARLERFTAQIASASEIQQHHATITNRSSRQRDSLSVLRLLELFTDLAEDSWDNVADLVVHRLGRAVTFSDCAAYLYDNAKDELVCYWTTGGATGLDLRDKRMKRGDGVSGWVAANRRAMLNSPVALDLLATGSPDTGSAGHALSIPLLDGERLVGVFTIYREEPELFSEGDHEVLESIAPALARLVAKVRPFYGSSVPSNHDFPTAHHLDAFLRRRLASGKYGIRGDGPTRLASARRGQTGRVGYRNSSGGAPTLTRWRHRVCLRQRHRGVPLGLSHGTRSGIYLRAARSADWAGSRDSVARLAATRCNSYRSNGWHKLGGTSRCC